MDMESEHEEEKVNLDFMLENYDLERRVGESKIDYHHRLFAIQVTQGVLISMYEFENSLDRSRYICKTFIKLLENGETQDVEIAIEEIQKMKENVKLYMTTYPELLDRKNIQEKLKDLKSVT